MNRQHSVGVDVLRELAVSRGDDFREDYSGRGMYGESCVGIVTDDPMEVIEEAAARGVRGAVTDMMGKQDIVYWPRLKVPA